MRSAWRCLRSSGSEKSLDLVVGRRQPLGQELDHEAVKLHRCPRVLALEARESFGGQPVYATIRLRHHVGRTRMPRIERHLADHRAWPELAHSLDGPID